MCVVEEYFILEDTQEEYHTTDFHEGENNLAVYGSSSKRDATLACIVIGCPVCFQIAAFRFFSFVPFFSLPIFSPVCVVLF